ncbi:transposase [Microbacterium sp. cx-59]|uniref:transposase n=1 Tax=Microbacterium sp. cx-59 TaxID=2891207 RepID=UPI001E29623B|nr:transposase [Microbacterium sp. cx-59]MCC4907396.1 transposase [Microbacterium sp. cx-59]
MAGIEDEADAVAAALYGLPPTQFTAARNAAVASASGAAASTIKAFRKPAVSAWAVNILVREGQLAEAIELSAALRDAQDDLDAKELTQLGRQRRQLVASLAKRAADLAQAAGTPLSPSARDAVTQTINAAVVDETVAAAVLTGRLLAPLEAGQLDGEAVSEYVAGSAPDGAARAASPVRNDLVERRARKAAEEAARTAEHAASAAVRDAERADARSAKAEEQARSLRARADDLRVALDRAVADAEAAASDAERLRRESAEARSRAGAAAREAERARNAVPWRP